MKRICIFLLTAVLLVFSACSKQDKQAPASSQPSSSFLGQVSSSVPPVSSGAGDSSAASSSLQTSAAPSSQKTPAGKTSSKAGQNSSSASPAKAKTVALTFPEGYTLSQIGDRLEKSSVCKKADFVTAAQNYDFSYYPLVKAIPSNAHRAYKLEGYLYPDTYEFYVGMKPQDAVGRFLRVAEQKIGTKYNYSGMTTDQVVTLASIIEREADDAQDMKLVSSVFHNRLKAKQKLEADATISYCTMYLLNVFGDKYKYYYNTYRCAALPAGPICNPGASALNAAANPAKTDYYYFITSNGKYFYQKTLDEHNAKLKELGMSPSSTVSG